MKLYNVFCTISWSNSWLICNMHWLSLQACSWVSGHASRRGYCCLWFPLENRKSMSLCKYATSIHTSSLTLRYIIVMNRCVFVYATKRLQTFKCNRSQPLHQACIIYQYRIVYRLTLAISFNDISRYWIFNSACSCSHFIFRIHFQSMFKDFKEEEMYYHW